MSFSDSVATLLAERKIRERSPAKVAKPAKVSPAPPELSQVSQVSQGSPVKSEPDPREYPIVAAALAEFPGAKVVAIRKLPITRRGRAGRIAATAKD